MGDEQIVQPAGAGQADLVGGVEHARGIAQQGARAVERERLEKDEAVYTMSECDAELKMYGTEVHKVVQILRKAMAELDALKEQYK